MKKKRILKIAGAILLSIVIIAAGVLGYFTINEYRPDKVENISVPTTNTRTLSIEDDFDIMSFNIGYGSLSKTADFFMDGGTNVQPESKEFVQKNMKGISSILKDNPVDAYFLQEVDLNSKRSYYMDQKKYYEKELGMPGLFAYNFKCNLVPYPWPMIGHVESGILTLSDLKMEEAKRISLPESFSWPVKTCNLKRCMLETRIPLEDSDAELVLINFHLEAYDEGEGKIAQSKMLARLLDEEYKKGNYVIAGGDFNQTFEMIDSYPIHNDENWVPGVIGEDFLPEGFRFAVDDTYPTCRLLNAPYTGSYEDSQVYVIDGFIVSPNVKVNSVNVIDTNFEYTDHQPVKLSFSFVK